MAGRVRSWSHLFSEDRNGECACIVNIPNVSQGTGTWELRSFPDCQSLTFERVPERRMTRRGGLLMASVVTELLRAEPRRDPFAVLLGGRCRRASRSVCGAWVLQMPKRSGHHEVVRLHTGANGGRARRILLRSGSSGGRGAWTLRCPREYSRRAWSGERSPCAFAAVARQ